MIYRRQKKAFEFEEHPFSKNVEGISNVHPEVLLLMKMLQTKIPVKNMNFNFYDL